MKKLKLDADSVQVESFVTALDEARRGTVHANSDLWCRSFQPTCWNQGCNSGITAPEYCPTSEAETCNGYPGCPGTSAAPGYTCDSTCSDYGCTVCNAWC